MEFVLDNKHIDLKKREYLLIGVFLALIVLIGVIGMLGQGTTVAIWIVAATGYAGFLFLLVKYLRHSFQTEREKLIGHRLIIDGNMLFIQQDGTKTAEFDLEHISLMKYKTKNAAVSSIIIDISKNCGFKLKGYENMDEVLNLLQKHVPSSKIKRS